MAGFFPGRPAMGRYTLLPSASNWGSVSEEAENVAPVVEGTLYFVLFHGIIICSSCDKLPSSCSKHNETFTFSRKYSFEYFEYSKNTTR